MKHPAEYQTKTFMYENPILGYYGGTWNNIPPEKFDLKDASHMTVYEKRLLPIEPSMPRFYTIMMQFLKEGLAVWKCSKVGGRVVPSGSARRSRRLEVLEGRILFVLPFLLSLVGEDPVRAFQRPRGIVHTGIGSGAFYYRASGCPQVRIPVFSCVRCVGNVNSRLARFLDADYESSSTSRRQFLKEGVVVWKCSKVGGRVSPSSKVEYFLCFSFFLVSSEILCTHSSGLGGSFILASCRSSGPLVTMSTPGPVRDLVMLVSFGRRYSWRCGAMICPHRRGQCCLRVVYLPRLTRHTVQVFTRSFDETRAISTYCTGMDVRRDQEHGVGVPDAHGDLLESRDSVLRSRESRTVVDDRPSQGRGARDLFERVAAV